MTWRELSEKIQNLPEEELNYPVVLYTNGKEDVSELQFLDSSTNPVLEIYPYTFHYLKVVNL